MSKLTDGYETGYPDKDAVSTTKMFLITIYKRKFGRSVEV